MQPNSHFPIIHHIGHNLQICVFCPKSSCLPGITFTCIFQNEILYEKKKKRRRLRLRRLGKRPPPSSPQDGQPMNDWEKEMRQVQLNKLKV